MSALDIIVPVAGAGDDFRRCAASLLRHTDLDRHRLVVVLDGAQDAGVEAAMADLAARLGAALSTLVNPQRRGFVVSANRGLAASRRDAILLNSDTVVTAGWAEKLQAAAGSAPTVGTATPFSNHGSICSLPDGWNENALPAGHDVDSFARLVEGAAVPSYPRLPSGVGFCLYLRRALLDGVGAFDEAAFGEGYGEEVDLCLRAARAGWEHVLDDATFVFHAGSASFGRSRARRVARGERTLARRHPHYRATIAAFLAADPLRPARQRVVAALRRAPAHPRRPQPPSHVLHLVHGWPPFSPAGTETVARALARRQLEWRAVSAYARLADPGRDHAAAVAYCDEGIDVRLVVNNFTSRDPLARNALVDRRLHADFAAFLARNRPQLVHVHHLAGHGFSLPAAAAALGIPYVLHLHDWWGLCGRANLLDAARQPCPGPALDRCSRCLPMTARFPARGWSLPLHALRAHLGRRVVWGAAAVIVGSASLAASLSELGLLAGAPHLRQVPYGIDLAGPGPQRALPRLPLRFGFVGSLLPHKGLHVAAAAFRDLDPALATLEVWGDEDAAPAYAAEVRALAGQARIRFHGRFAEAEKVATLGGLDALLVPSLGRESFGLVAYEALACGTPVIVARGSALAELAAQLPAGAAFTPGAADELRQVVHGLIARPATLDDWARVRPNVRSADAMAAEVEAVYAEVLARRRV